MNNKFLTKLLLTFIGAILFIAYIWHRFIRERLPKNIPFNLTEYGCVILIYICCLYIFIITILVVTFQTKNDTLTRLSDYIYKPLKVLDESIKENALIAYYHKKFMMEISKKSINYTLVYYCFNIMPRIPLILVFSLETLYFHHLEYLYKILLIGLLILFYKYFIHSLKYAKELYIVELESMVREVQTEYIKEAEERDEDDDFGEQSSFSFLTVRKFIDFQTDSIFYNDHKYMCNPLTYNAYSSTFPAESSIKDAKKEPLRLFDIVIPLCLHIEQFDLLHNYNHKIKNIKIIIFSTYLICWSYILIISIHTLPHDAFSWLWTIQDLQEPFSLTDCNVILRGSETTTNQYAKTD